MSKLAHLWKRLSPASAFEAAMSPHMERLWRLALRFQGDPSDAEDLLQELMARAWQHRQTVLELDAPAPWLARVLYRLHVDRWRRQGGLESSVTLDEAMQVEASLEAETVLNRIAVNEVLEEVNRLPEHQRLVLLLHDGEGYGLKAIAEMLDVPTGTLKSRLHRARATIRHTLADGTETPFAACQVGRGG